MTIVLRKDYPKTELEKSHVLCIDQDRALQEDIRALRIGILNIMPKAETYEFSLLQPLGRSVLQIEPIWIRLKTHVYSSSDQAHLQNMYIPFEEAIKNDHLDGLLLTGAPVEDKEFEDIVYWEEITRILKYAHNNIPSTLGICWGGLALAKILGINKTTYEKKVFGVYETENLCHDNPVTGELDDLFWCPQSRHSGIGNDVLEAAAAKGTISLLAKIKGGDYTIFDTPDHRFVMHLGHPEYEPHRLVYEYQRDVKLGRTDVEPPVNIDLEKPMNRWRGHRTEFFSQWIKFIHDMVSF